MNVGVVFNHRRRFVVLDTRLPSQFRYKEKPTEMSAGLRHLLSLTRKMLVQRSPDLALTGVAPEDSLATFYRLGTGATRLVTRADAESVATYVAAVNTKYFIAQIGLAVYKIDRPDFKWAILFHPQSTIPKFPPRNFITEFYAAAVGWSEVYPSLVSCNPADKIYFAHNL